MIIKLQGLNNLLGGHLRPAVAHLLPSYIKLYGVEAAAEVAAFEDAHVQIISDLIAAEKIDCDFMVTKSFDIFTDIEEARAAKEAYDELLQTGVAKATMEGITWTGSDQAEEISGVKGAVGCFSFKAAHLWPYKLMMHLLGIAASKGLNLQTNTPVTSLSRSTSTGDWIATTERGSITAPKVIVATNAYTSGLLPEYAGKIVPARGICSRIVVLPGSKHPPLTCTYGLRLPGLGFDYLIPRNDGSIIVGGGRSTFRMHRDQWHNVTDDSTLIKAAEDYFDGYMQRTFVGWEDSGATLDRIWTGIMGYNSDSLPSIGEVPGRKGCYIAAGFEGHGMPVIFLATKGVAKMVNKDVTYEDSGLPIVYKTTKERLVSPRDDMAPPE